MLACPDPSLIRKEVRMRKLLVGALAMTLASAPAASAQDMQPTWYTIFADHVAISDRQAYDEAGRDFARLFEEKGVKDVAWVTITGGELGYTYAIPGYGPADMATMNAAWGAAMTAVGDEGRRISARSDALVESREMYYLLLRPELSYNSDAVAFKVDEPYRHYVQFAVHPTKTQEFEASAKAWAKAYADHGIERGFRVYEYITGADLPMYLLVEDARDEAHHETLGAQIDKTLGADQEPLMRQTGATLRSVREMEGWVRPELSYPAMSGGN
jgi:hypothetical protein